MILPLAYWLKKRDLSDVYSSCKLIPKENNMYTAKKCVIDCIELTHDLDRKHSPWQHLFSASVTALSLIYCDHSIKKKLKNKIDLNL